MRRSSSLGALRHRDFARYVTGSFVSHCGTWCQNISQALLVHRLTDGNTFWVGMTGFSQFVAVIVLAPWTGALADRADRRTVILSAQSAALVLTSVLAVVSALDRATVANVITIALLLGVANAFSAPAAKAMLPALVPRESLGKAVALDSASFNLARVVGPLIGALLVAQVGVTAAFIFNVASYSVFIAAIATLRVQAWDRSAAVRGRLRDTIRMIRRERRLLAAISVTAAVSAATDPVSTLSPAFATRVYDLPDTFAGVIVGAFGVGAVAAAVTTSPLLEKAGPRLVRLVGLTAAGIAGWVALPWAGAGVVSIVVAGYGYFAANTQATTVLQVGIDDAHRGRVLALWSVAFLGVRPISSLLTGSLALVAGLRLAAATVLLGLAAAVTIVVRATRSDDAQIGATASPGAASAPSSRAAT